MFPSSTFLPSALHGASSLAGMDRFAFTTSNIPVDASLSPMELRHWLSPSPTWDDPPQANLSSSLGELTGGSADSIGEKEAVVGLMRCRSWYPRRIQESSEEDP